jgi:hypothetical protein
MQVQIAICSFSKPALLYLRAIAIFSEHLGETHPHTQNVLRNFIGFLQAAIEGDRTADLSDHPIPRSRL